MKTKFPFYRQLETMDCGPACLKMIAKFYGRSFSLDAIREKCSIDRQGVSLLGISEGAESIGLRTTAALATYDAIIQEQPLPAIIHWRQSHFIVLYAIDKKGRALVADPAHGIIRLSRADFISGWSGNMTEDDKEGMILYFEPTPEFYQSPVSKNETIKRDIAGLVHYIKPYKRYVYQLLMGLGAVSLIQLAFPFFTQGIVDIGVRTKNISFINLLLMAQLMLFIGKISGDFIRSWILLHIGSRINISMIANFLAKLTRLPIAFFDGKMTGDIMQRVSDHQRIQTFVTSSATTSLFSILNILLFACILLWYNTTVFLLFMSGSILYITWILLFLRKRRNVDYQKFEALSNNQSSLIQFIQGMQEIKLNNAEKQNRWKWERIQAKLFSTNLKGLALEQHQQIGALFINESRNILITFIAAKAVITGSITLGMMLSIQYIIGQLNTPVNDLLNFIRSWQDAKISLERVGEIFSRDDEEQDSSEKIRALPADHSLHAEGIQFQYGGPSSPLVLNNIHFTIPHGKVTAIVGASGSGKTTLMKLLLKFYEPVTGRINIGHHDLGKLSQSTWRGLCGAVMQDGYIFSDTIAKNIAVGDEKINKEQLLYAVKVANIQDFIEELPLTYNTRIGNDGIGISGGQRQRILIARAVYKDPQFIFFDEATSSLDAENEKIIMQNLDTFFKGRTVVIIAHRLSTVTHADQILVLHKGKLVERGSHMELTSAKGAYYSLVKNQLELGS